MKLVVLFALVGLVLFTAQVLYQSWREFRMTKNKIFIKNEQKKFEIVEWLEANIDPDDWRPVRGRYNEIHFAKATDAVTVKLMFGEDLND